jgi:hypothetical protein
MITVNSIKSKYNNKIMAATAFTDHTALRDSCFYEEGFPDFLSVYIGSDRRKDLDQIIHGSIPEHSGSRVSLLDRVASFFDPLYCCEKLTSSKNRMTEETKALVPDRLLVTDSHGESLLPCKLKVRDKGFVSPDRCVSFTRGLCSGISEYFGYLYLNSEEADIDEESRLIKIAKVFEDGAPIDATIGQHFLLKHGFDLKPLLAVKDFDGQEDLLVNEISNLPKGIYKISIRKFGVPGHSVNLVVSGKNKYYLFDSNIGLLKFTGSFCERRILRFLQRYKKENLIINAFQKKGTITEDFQKRLLVGSVDKGKSKQKLKQKLKKYSIIGGVLASNFLSLSLPLCLAKSSISKSLDIKAGDVALSSLISMWMSAISVLCNHRINTNRFKFPLYNSFLGASLGYLLGNQYNKYYSVLCSVAVGSFSSSVSVDLSQSLVKTALATALVSRVSHLDLSQFFSRLAFTLGGIAIAALGPKVFTVAENAMKNVSAWFRNKLGKLKTS